MEAICSLLNLQFTHCTQSCLYILIFLICHFKHQESDQIEQGRQEFLINCESQNNTLKVLKNLFALMPLCNTNTVLHVIPC